jgi:hypothetical protein
VVCHLLPWVVLGWFLLFGVVLVLAMVFLSLLWILGLFLIVVGPWCSFLLSSVGGPPVCPPSSLLLSHPVFTLQAVAHSGGGGCWLLLVL